jgi:hypothetical protein
VTLNLATPLTGAEADQAQNLGMISADAYELFTSGARGATILAYRLRWYERPLARWLARRLTREAIFEQRRSLEFLRAASATYRREHGHVLDLWALEPPDLLALDLLARACVEREANE